MPLFPPPIPTPQIVNYPGVEQATSTAAVTAGSAYFAPVTILAPVTLTQMRCLFSGSPTGNCDMGIYDSTGTNGKPNNLLQNTGVNAAVTGAFTKNLAANLSLSPGLYWLAFMDTVADTIDCRQFGGSGMGPMYKTSSTSLTVLPSTAGTIADVSFMACLFALVSGGYS